MVSTFRGPGPDDRKPGGSVSRGYSFQARILDVAHKHFSCPEGDSLRQAAYEKEIAALAGKTIADVPELLTAWNEDIPPETVPVNQNHWGSGYRFRCPAGHRNTRQSRSYLFGGCSASKANETRKANAKPVDADPSSSRLMSEISSKRHLAKNGDLRFASISPESRRTVWWQDPVCGHEFEATPHMWSHIGHKGRRSQRTGGETL